MWCIASSTRISPKRSLPSSFSAWRTSCTETLIFAPHSDLYVAARIEAGEPEDTAYPRARSPDDRPAAVAQPRPASRDQPGRPAVHETRSGQGEDQALR